MDGDVRRSVEYRIPISWVGNTAGKWVLNVRLEGPFPLSEAEWKQFEQVLEVMKPGLVEEKIKLTSASGRHDYPA